MKQFFLICLSVLALAMTLSACSTPTSMPPTVPTAILEPTISPTPLPSPTPVPSPTLPPTPPTGIPMAKLYVVDIMEEAQVPLDLVEHLYFYPQGGAGNFGDQPPDNLTYWKTAYYDSVQPAVPGELSWLGCGITDTESPQIFLTLPDRSTLELEVKLVNEEGEETVEPTCASAKYEVAPGAAFGLYSLQLKYGDGELRDTVTLEPPTERVHGNYQNRDWFAGYQPGETIHIFVYSGQDPLNRYTQYDINSLNIMREAGIYFLITEQTILADQYGSFQIDLESPTSFKGELYLNVRGEQSGAMSNRPNIGWLKEQWPPVCSEPVRLKVGDTAKVTDYQVIPNLSGTTVKVLSGPICAYEGWAWIVSTSGQDNLLLCEGDVNGHTLELVTP